MNLAGVIHLNKTGICIICGVVLILFIYMISSNSHDQVITSRETINLNLLIRTAIRAAKNGGKEVVAGKDHLKVKSKGLTKEGMQDSVTTADYNSHCAMLATLKHDFPNLNVISEEATTECSKDQKIDFTSASEELGDLQDEWVSEKDVTVWIDPLDATHEYTEKLYQYVTTMVCVAVKGRPIIGVIHKPFLRSEDDKTFWAWVGKGKSSNLKPLDHAEDKLKVIISRSHSGDIKKVLSEKLQNFEIVIAAGAGYKSLEVATGQVDGYLHITAIKKWDICAGNAIIDAVGGKMTTKFNELIDYMDEKMVQNENGLIATLKHHDQFIGKL